MVSIDHFAKSIEPFRDDLNLKLVTVDDAGWNGSGQALYQNSFMCLRLLSDRGVASVEIASLAEPDTWLDLTLIMNSDLGRSLTTTHALDDIMQYTVDRQAYLYNLMTDLQACKERLRTAEQQRFAAMFPDIKRVAD